VKGVAACLMNSTVPQKRVKLTLIAYVALFCRKSVKYDYKNCSMGHLGLAQL